MNTVPNSPSPAQDPAAGPGQTGVADPAGKRRWRNRAIAAATGTVLLGAAVFGATAASAANPSTSSTSAATSTASPGAASGAARHPGLRPFTQVLRQELRIDIQAKSGFGDNAHEVAYLLIHHKAGFGKLPANLQADLKSLEGAAAADRDADAGKIKDTALNGGYGDKIQKAAKAIQANLAKDPATTAPATPKS